MKNRYCKQCRGITPWNRADAFNSIYICEGCGTQLNNKDLDIKSVENKNKYLKNLSGDLQ